MKVTKGRKASSGVYISRNASSGRFTTLVMPGKGPMPVVREDTLNSAKRAAGVRLRAAIENTRHWKESE